MKLRIVGDMNGSVPPIEWQAARGANSLLIFWQTAVASLRAAEKLRRSTGSKELTYQTWFGYHDKFRNKSIRKGEF